MRINDMLIVSIYDGAENASVVELTNNNVYREYHNHLLVDGRGFRLPEDGCDDFKLFTQIVELVKDGGGSVDIQQKFPVFSEYTIMVCKDGNIDLQLPRRRICVPSEWTKNHPVATDDITPRHVDATDEDLPF